MLIISQILRLALQSCIGSGQFFTAGGVPFTLPCSRKRRLNDTEEIEALGTLAPTPVDL